MTYTQTIEIPADRKVHLDLELPETAPVGTVCLQLIPYQPPPLPRIGFLKGHISIPEDFDTMGGNEIAALFGGNR
jgi:hypothetical protein